MDVLAHIGVGMAGFLIGNLLLFRKLEIGQLPCINYCVGLPRRAETAHKSPAQSSFIRDRGCC